MKFRFGNGSVDYALSVVYVPVSIGERSAIIAIHKVPGQGPILISNLVLRAISHGIDYDSNTLDVMIKHNDGLVEADRNWAQTFFISKSINGSEGITSGIKTLAIVNVHGVNDPVLNLLQIHILKSTRRMTDELKTHFGIGAGDHL